MAIRMTLPLFHKVSVQYGNGEERMERYNFADSNEARGFFHMESNGIITQYSFTDERTAIEFKLRFG